MGLIKNTVNIKWNKKTRKYYEDLGYEFTKYGDYFEVKINDLSKGCKVYVDCICDNCGCNMNILYTNYIRTVKNKKTYCNKCSVKLYGINNYRKARLKNSKTLYQWCIENNRQDVLDRWDYELNGCSPKEIGYKSSIKYWFKCDKRPEHKSELKNIASFTSGQEGSIDCKQCNSIAQYILDNFPNKDLYDVWDKEMNGELDPWIINKYTHNKYWFICQEKYYHGSYNSSCIGFSRLNSRCPYCCNLHGMVHPKDSLGQYIIDNYGEEILWQVWSSKNKNTPFEYTPNSKIKIWWKCYNGKHKDYLRHIGNSNRYEFRCPKCVEEINSSIIEEKTKTYLEELGYEVLTEYKCTIVPINPKTKHPMPFDNEIVLENGKHLIIEVHGKQHYDYNYYKYRFKCNEEKAKEMLHYQQVKDRYKRIYAKYMGYEYLEIPYTDFEGKNKEQYKELIDNKINKSIKNMLMYWLILVQMFMR